MMAGRRRRSPQPPELATMQGDLDQSAGTGLLPYQQHSQEQPAHARLRRRGGTPLGWIVQLLPRMPTATLWVVLAIAGGVLVSALVALNQMLGATIFFTSWASSAAILLSVPEAHACRPVRVGSSHMIAALVGLACHAVFPTSSFAIGGAVAISLLIALSLDALHPPAMANAAFAFAAPSDASVFVMTALVGALGLATIALLLGRLPQSGEGAGV